jgi:protein ImuA
LSSAAVLSLAHVPHVWRAPELARAGGEVLSTGHAALDMELPGGGWPVGSLVELLQESGVARHVWQLLLPALAQVGAKAGAKEGQVSAGGPVVLVAPPHEPFAPSLAAQGLAADRLLCIRARKPAASLWAAEQALRCADVPAVLAWLPRARSAELRRLHLGASLHGKLLFVMREARVAADASPARLRLLLEGVDELRLRILKRRGPPLEDTLVLPAHPARVTALLAARKGKGVVLPAPVPSTSAPPPVRRPAIVGESAAARGKSHVLDRAATPA